MTITSDFTQDLILAPFAAPAPKFPALPAPPEASCVPLGASPRATLSLSTADPASTRATNPSRPALDAPRLSAGYNCWSPHGLCSSSPTRQRTAPACVSTARDRFIPCRGACLTEQQALSHIRHTSSPASSSTCAVGPSDRIVRRACCPCHAVTWTCPPHRPVGPEPVKLPPRGPKR